MACSSTTIPEGTAYYVRLDTPATQVSAACQPFGGQPAGAARATGPITVCCL
jgi:hypothetical protein